MRPVIVLVVFLAFVPLSVSQAQVPGDFNGNGVVDVSDLIYLVSIILPFHGGTVDTGTYIWYVGDLNYDGVYHTVADWWQLPLEITGGADVPDNPPEPYYLDSIIVSDAAGAPGDSVVLPLFIESVENLSGIMIHAMFDSLNLVNCALSPGSDSLDYRAYIEGGSLYANFLFFGDGLQQGAYHAANLHFTISENVPPDTDLTIELVAGDYYPSGFSNVSYPTYFIRPILVNGIVHVRTTGIADENSPDQIGYGLKNFPNPFNSLTTVDYQLTAETNVIVAIYSLLGQRVVTLFEGNLEAGQHSITWDASDLPSGVYFARLEAGENTETIKMVLLK